MGGESWVRAELRWETWRWGSEEWTRVSEKVSRVKWGRCDKRH